MLLRLLLSGNYLHLAHLLELLLDLLLLGCSEILLLLLVCGLPQPRPIIALRLLELLLLLDVIQALLLLMLLMLLLVELIDDAFAGGSRSVTTASWLLLLLLLAS